MNTAARKRTIGLMGIVFLVSFVTDVRAESKHSDNQASVSRALSLLNAGNASQAVNLLAPVTKTYPADRDVWHVYAAALEQSGELIEAIPAYRRAAGDKTHRIEALYGLARIHTQLGQFDDAFDALHHLVGAGFRDYWVFHENPRLADLQQDPRFAELPTVYPYEKQSLELDGGGSLDYVVVLPLDYDEDKQYPVLVALQPAREEWGISYFWGEDAARRGWVVVQPTMTGSSDDDGDSDEESGHASLLEDNISTLLEALDTRFNVEGEKFHLAGCSAGGRSAFDIAIRFPDWFHSLTGLPGVPSSNTTDIDLRNLEGVYVSQFVGGKDGAFWTNRTKSTHKKLKHLNVATYMKTLPADGHVPFSLAGDTFMKYMDKVRRKTSGRHAAIVSTDARK